MAEGLARVEALGETMAVLCLDLDNFKGVNDTLGHPIGDRLLGTIAERIRGAVGEGDTIARLGGDEFAILQADATPQAAGALARRLVEIISEPIEIDGQEINSGVSIGIALAPNDGSAADHLMKCADLALYRAKAEGRGTFRFFEPDMDARIQARRALEVDLRRALAAGEFALAYQPQIKLASNELIAMEALLRWNHAERGPVPPSEFIPLAEEMGLIVPLGEWVLREACKEAARWPDPIKVAVNLSPVQFRNRGLVDDGDAGARRRAACAAPARAGDHRSRAAAGRRGDRHHAAPVARARRAHRDGRFRHRLFVAQLSAQRSRSTRSRSTARSSRTSTATATARSSSRRSRASAHSLGIETTAEGDRDRGAARDRAPRRLHRDAGLSGKPAAPGLRGARPHRALPPPGRGGISGTPSR